jgi:hypothetical protein
MIGVRDTPEYARLLQLEAENKNLRAAIEEAVKQIRRCDYTPALSTLLTANKAGGVSAATKS